MTKLSIKRFCKWALTLLPIFILGSCATHQISSPTGVVEGQRASGGPLLDCRGYFAQAGQEIKANINALQGPGVGVGVGATPLLALDSIAGDMIVHYQRYCHQYNVGLISREEFLRKTDMLHATQTAIRAIVGAVPPPMPGFMSPGLTPAGMGAPFGGGVQSIDPNFPSQPGGAYPDGTTKPIRIAESIFKVILEAMRPSPGTTGAQVPSTGFPSLPSSPPVGREPLSLPAITVPAVGSPMSGTAPGPVLGVEELFQSIVAESKQAAKNQGNMEEPVQAVLSEISYKNTGYGTPLGLFIRSKLQEQLSKSGTFLLVEPRRLRGIGGIAKPKSVVTLAENSGADVVINGNYWDMPEGVELFVSMRQRQDGVVLGTPRVLIPSALLPVQAVAVPPNLQQAQSNELVEDTIAPLSSTQTSNPLKVEVWTDRGPGAVYSEGEELLVNVRVTQDAYVRLFYTDASNQTYQIFPNRYRADGRIRAGSVITIPGPEDGFAFQVKAPFGIESLTAIASRKPFSSQDAQVPYTGPFQKVAKGLRGVAVVSSSAGEGEAVRDGAVLTTVPRAK